jgi:hypothetical protein
LTNFHKIGIFQSAISNQMGGGVDISPGSATKKDKNTGSGLDPFGGTEP